MYYNVPIFIAIYGILELTSNAHIITWIHGDNVITYKSSSHGISTIGDELDYTIGKVGVTSTTSDGSNHAIGVKQVVGSSPHHPPTVANQSSGTRTTNQLITSSIAK